MLFNSLSREIFQVLKGYGKTLSLYDESGSKTYEPRLARRMYDHQDKMMVTVTQDGVNSSVNMYLSEVVDLASMEDLITTLRNIATRYNVLFNLRNYGKELTPRDFASQVRSDMNESWDNADINSTGEWSDYTIEELKGERKDLLAKKSRTPEEQKMLRQIDFAIRAKRHFKGGVKEGRIAELESFLKETYSLDMDDNMKEKRKKVREELRGLREYVSGDDPFVKFAKSFFADRENYSAKDEETLIRDLKIIASDRFPGKGSLKAIPAGMKGDDMVAKLDQWQVSGISDALYALITSFISKMEKGEKLSKNEMFFVRKMADQVPVSVREYDEAPMKDKVRVFAERFLSKSEDVSDSDIQELTDALKYIGAGRFPGKGKLREIPDVQYRDGNAELRHRLDAWQSANIPTPLFLFVTYLTEKLLDGKNLTSGEKFFADKMAAMVKVRKTVEEKSLDRFFSDFEPDDFLLKDRDEPLKEYRAELPSDINPDIASYIFALDDQNYDVSAIASALRKEFGKDGQKVNIKALLGNEDARAWWKNSGKKMPVIHTHIDDTGDNPPPASMLEARVEKDTLDGYGPRKGLEGPWRLRNGGIYYYDPREGQYYNPKTDMYVPNDEVPYILGDMPYPSAVTEGLKATMDDVRATMDRVARIHGHDEAARQAAELYWEDLDYPTVEAAYEDFLGIGFDHDMEESIGGDMEKDFEDEIRYDPKAEVEPSVQDADEFYEGLDLANLRKLAGLK